MAVNVLLCVVVLVLVIVNHAENYFMNNDYSYENWDFYISNANYESALTMFEHWVTHNTSISLHPSATLKYFNYDKRFGVVANQATHKAELISATPIKDMICGVSSISVECKYYIYYINFRCNICNIAVSDETPYNWSPKEFPEQPSLTYLDPSIIGRISNSIYYRLIYELLIQSDSKFSPYLGIFPSVADYQQYWVTYWGTDEMEEWEKGNTNAKQALYDQLNTNKQLLSHGRRVCNVFGYDATPLMRRVLCDQTLLQWARIAYITRSWSFPHEDCFIPYADMFNHGGMDNSLFNYAQASCIASIRSHAVGDEYTQTYRKDLTYADFFLMNGFVSESGVIVVTNNQYKKYMIQPTSKARHAMKILNCNEIWSTQRWRYLHEIHMDGPVCEVSLEILQCYRLGMLGASVQDTKKVLKSYKQLLRNNDTKVMWLGNWSSGIIQPLSYWDESMDDIPVWEAIQSDMQSSLEELKTSEIENQVLYHTGKSKALRSMGYLRIVERQAIQYCLSTIQYHIQLLYKPHNYKKMKKKQSTVGHEGNTNKRERKNKKSKKIYNIQNEL